jgi:uncharacterized membrane protein YhaH (DUF805 family)
MNFVEAISSGFSNYVKFSGRAFRSEYWYWVLFWFVGAVVTEIIDSVLGLTLIYPLFSLAILLPSLAVAVRRLHDLDRSGWWILLGFIPIVGFIILIIWYCSRGTPGPNRFGPDPLSTDGWARAAA